METETKEVTYHLDPRINSLYQKREKTKEKLNFTIGYADRVLIMKELHNLKAEIDAAEQEYYSNKN